MQMATAVLRMLYSKNVFNRLSLPTLGRPHLKLFSFIKSVEETLSIGSADSPPGGNKISVALKDLGLPVGGLTVEIKGNKALIKGQIAA